MFSRFFKLIINYLKISEMWKKDPNDLTNIKSNINSSFILWKFELFLKNPNEYQKSFKLMNLFNFISDL
jgi:hypothetical protein